MTIGKGADILTKMPCSLPIYHMGYAAGSHLKISCESVFRLDFLSCRARGDSLVDVPCLKNDSAGLIQNVIRDDENSADEYYISPLKSNGRSSVVAVDKSGEARKQHKNGNSSFYELSNFHIAATHIHGGDHLILCLTTSTGSSGGVYLDENGNLIAIHIGSFIRSINTALGLPKNYFAHVALLPNVAFEILFLYKVLIPESREFCVSTKRYLLCDMQVGMYLLATENEFSNDFLTVGVIVKVLECSSGGKTSVIKYSCLVDTPNMQQLELRFVVNQESSKIQAIKSSGTNDHVCIAGRTLVINPTTENALVDRYIYLCKEGKADNFEKVDVFPSFFRILNWNRETSLEFYQSWNIDFQLGSDPERKLDREVIASLIGSKESPHSDADEKHGKVFHYTHTWGNDDYASFHYIERQNGNGNHLFIVGIGQHIGRDRRSYRFLKGQWTPPLFDIYKGKGNGKPKLIFENEDGSLDFYFTDSLNYKPRLAAFESENKSHRKR